MDLLDNPVWHALTGPQKTVAQRRSAAARYEPEVAMFAAVPDEPTAASWSDLVDIVGPGAIAFLFLPPPDRPPDWDELFTVEAVQMVATAVEPEVCELAQPLGVDDVPEMLALVGRTQPGPFEQRTIELGEYIGIRDEAGALVAMAGERMNPPGYREVSAVCTDDHVRGRGYAGALVRHLCGRIAARGEVPILHVVTTNVGAIRLYERLGFTVRRQVGAIGLRTPH